MEPFNIRHRIGNAFITCSNNVHKFSNVIVSRHGIVLDEQFRRVPNANQQFNFWSVLWAAWWEPAKFLPEEMMEIPFKPIVELPNDNYIYALFYQDKTVFGHLWDTLQSLSSIEEKEIDGTLLCHYQNDINDMDFHWSAFGYPHDKRVAIDTEKYNYLVPTLYIPDLVVPPAQLHPELIPWIRSKYDIVKDAAPRRLYLSRSKAGRRHVKNETEILPILKHHGFTIVYGDEGIKKHIEYFQNAEIVIGCIGSLLRNLMFCKTRPKVIEYCPAPYEYDNSIQQLAFQMGIEDYQRIIYPEVEHGDIIVDPKDLNFLCTQVDP